MNTQQQTVLKTVTELASSLPTEGKVAVLEHLLKQLKQISPEDIAKLTPTERQSLLQVLPPAANAVVELSTEEKLRAENRIQNDPAILAKLGFKGAIPTIIPELMAEAARTNGTLVLDYGVSLVDYAKALNAALGKDKANLHLRFWGRAEEATFATESSGDAPQWKIVPNTVREDTLGFSKVASLKHIPGSQTSEPRDTALMLGYNNLQTGEQMPGFVNRYTFTSQKNTLVGSSDDGVYVYVDNICDDDDGSSVGLAPRLAPESK